MVSTIVRTSICLELIILLMAPIMIDSSPELAFGDGMKKNRLCGRALMNTLASVCRNEYGKQLELN